MGAIDDYSALIDAVESQRERLQGPQQPDLWGGETAKRFRADPKRQMDDNYEILAKFVRPDDVFVDAGGGSGRLGSRTVLWSRRLVFCGFAGVFFVGYRTNTWLAPGAESMLFLIPVV